MGKRAWAALGLLALALALLALGACGGGAAVADAQGDAGDGQAAETVGADVETEVAADVCAPSCAVSRCGEADGCGGLCAPCPTEVSCPDCSLVLRVISREAPFVRLALDFEPAEGDPLPTLVDLRLAVDGDATLLDLEVGQAVEDAGKAPFADPETGEPWQLLDDGTVRVSLGSLSSATPIGAGRWLTWRFRLGGAFEPLTAPVVLHLDTAEPVFAPPGAAAPLWGQALESPVALWPEAR